MFKLAKLLKINLTILLIGVLFMSTNNVFSADVPMYGWIWNDNVGWISLREYSSTSPYGQVANNPEYAVTFDLSQNPDTDTGLYNDGGSVVSSNNGRFAWNENIGWIDLDSVSYNVGTRQLEGTAQVLLSNEGIPNNSGGWNGIINFTGNTGDIDGKIVNGSPFKYNNVAYETIKKTGTYNNSNTLSDDQIKETCSFSGYAWGGIYTLGWLAIDDSFSFDLNSGCRVPKIADFYSEKSDTNTGAINDTVVRSVETNPVNSDNYTDSSGITLNWQVENGKDIAYYELEASVVDASIPTSNVNKFSKDYTNASSFDVNNCLIDHKYDEPTTIDPTQPRNKILTDCDIRDDGSSTSAIISDSNGKNNKIQIKPNGNNSQSIKVYPVDLSGGKISYKLTAYNKFGDVYTYTPTWEITSNYSLTMRSWTNIQRNDNRTDVNVFSEIQDSPLDEGTYTFKLCQHITPPADGTVAITCTPIQNNQNPSTDIVNIEYKVTGTPSICPGDTGCNHTNYLTSGNLDASDKKDDPIVFQGIGIPTGIPILGVYKVDVLMEYTDPSDVNFPDKARRNTVSIRNLGNRQYKEVSP